MEINYLSTKSMVDSVAELYESIYKVINFHCKLNKFAMSKMHSLGYNGFKRWHRYRSKQFFDLEICLCNELYDKFRISLTHKDYELSYAPNSMEDHLKNWDKALLSSVEELGSLNKEHYELTGSRCKIIECVMHKLIRDYEKVGRYLKRFNESDWLTLDIHIVDDKIHEKYKAKEEKHEWYGK